MNKKTQDIARFGLLTALSLVLGYIDRATPLTWILGGTVPGIKLGLANTVLLYALFLMDWKGSVLLMLVKVLLSGFMFGSMSAILYSLSGGVLSLIVMLIVKRFPFAGTLGFTLLAFAADGYLICRHFPPRGQMLLCVILISAAAAASAVLCFMMRTRADYHVIGVSLCGAAAHNIGQVIMAVFVMGTPQLLYTYMPVLIGIGVVVGCMTGLVAKMVFHAIRSHGF